MVNFADPPGWTVAEAFDELTVKVGVAAPDPLSETVCGDPTALSLTARVAEKLATEAGEKVTAMVQLLPAASDSPHVLVWLKSLGFVPPVVIPVIDRVALPVFFSVAVCAVVVVPTTAEKLRDDGVSETRRSSLLRRPE
jgi:hypothetical protein